MTDSLSDQKRRSSRAERRSRIRSNTTVDELLPVTGLSLHTAMMAEDVGHWMDLNARLRRNADGSVEVVLLTLRRVPE